MRLHSTHSRDSSLRKLSAINRWLIAASVILTGLLTDVAAHAFPSKSKAAAANKAGSKHHTAKAQATKPAPKLDPPAQAPETTPETAPGEEPAPEEEAAPAEPAPESEAAPEPAPESTPAQEAPVEEPSAPVISGGS